MVAVPITTFFPGKCSTIVSAYHRFFILSSFVTICDVSPESAINDLLSYFLLGPFVINILTCMISSLTFAASFLDLFFV